MHELDTLYETSDTLYTELEEANEKIRKAGGKMSVGDVDVIDKITHAIKSATTTIAMIEASDDYSNDNDRSMNRRMMDGRSNARGRTGNVRRDSMGRYSLDDAENAMMDALEDYMDIVKDPSKKREAERFKQKMGR